MRHEVDFGLCKKSRKNHSQWCLIGRELGVIRVVINRAENGQGENKRWVGISGLITVRLRSRENIME